MRSLRIFERFISMYKAWAKAGSPVANAPSADISKSTECWARDSPESGTACQGHLVPH